MIFAHDDFRDDYGNCLFLYGSQPIVMSSASTRDILWYLRVDPELWLLCYLCYLCSAIYAVLSILCYLCYAISDVRSMQSTPSHLRHNIYAVLYIYACYYAVSAVRQAPIDNACSSALHLCYLFKVIASSIKHWHLVQLELRGGSCCCGCLLDCDFWSWALEGFVRRLCRRTLRSMLCSIAQGGREDLCMGSPWYWLLTSTKRCCREPCL